MGHMTKLLSENHLCVRLRLNPRSRHCFWRHHHRTNVARLRRHNKAGRRTSWFRPCRPELGKWVWRYTNLHASVVRDRKPTLKIPSSNPWKLAWSNSSNGTCSNPWELQTGNPWKQKHNTKTQYNTQTQYKNTIQNGFRGYYRSVSGVTCFLVA